MPMMPLSLPGTGAKDFASRAPGVSDGGRTGFRGSLNRRPSPPPPPGNGGGEWTVKAPGVGWGGDSECLVDGDFFKNKRQN